MTDKIDIKILRIDDLMSFYQLRLKSLQECPNAFMSDYEAELKAGPQHFENIFNKNEPSYLIFGAFEILLLCAYPSTQ
jgi:hypothetical protein